MYEYFSLDIILGEERKNNENVTKKRVYCCISADSQSLCAMTRNSRRTVAGVIKSAESLKRRYTIYPREL